jgi:hypothetical protein
MVIWERKRYIQKVIEGNRLIITNVAPDLIKQLPLKRVEHNTAVKFLEITPPVIRYLAERVLEGISLELFVSFFFALV